MLAAARLIRHQTTQFALSGVIGVAFGAFVATRTGNAEDFFLPGILINIGSCLVYLTSIALRRPLLGLILSTFTGEGRALVPRRRPPPRLQRASWIWVGLFAFRLSIQLPLYLSGLVGPLAVARVVTGIPAFALGRLALLPAAATDDRRAPAQDGIPGSLSARAWTSFAVVSFLWGIPYLFISVAVDDGVPPGFLAWARVLLGALVLIPLAWRAGLLGSLRGRDRLADLYAIAEITIPFPLIAFGEQHISSSVAAILIAATPLIVAVLAIGSIRASGSGGAGWSGSGSASPGSSPWSGSTSRATATRWSARSPSCSPRSATRPGR